MHLKISGIGKICNSELVMKGITVVAGENFTGKSTIGKALYCIFNAFCNMQTAIRNERISHIFRIIRSSPFGIHPILSKKLSLKLINDIENTNIKNLSEDNIRKTIAYAIPERLNSVLNDNEKYFIEMIDNIRRSLIVSDDKMQEVLVNRHFQSEFEGKVNHVNLPDATGNVSLIIKGKNVDVHIKDNKCNGFTDNIGIRHNAIYIDTPFVMDHVQIWNEDSAHPFYMMNYGFEINHRENLRRRLGKKNSKNTLIDEVIIDQKIANILSKIRSIISGEFREENDDLMFIEAGLIETIPFVNVSAGMKTFLVIKRLLELGEIQEQDVLILDEPEIHLHPVWQLHFAEILVLLQKEFNLRILLTTHSPYFLNAIEAYGKMHSIKDKINYYLAENNGDTSDVREVTSNIDAIYKLLATPLRKLDDMEYDD